MVIPLQVVAGLRESERGSRDSGVLAIWGIFRTGEDAEGRRVSLHEFHHEESLECT